MLSLQNIVKKFATKTIVDHVSFDVQPGEIAILLGQSGVGKSTILRILAHLETMDAGKILLDNEPLDFKKVGMVFQDFNLFSHLTVVENITLPLIKVLNFTPEDAHQQAMKLLQEFNMEHKADVFAANLSGGQKQRVAIARTLAMNPKILCMDEPTSALDPQLKHELAQIIQKVANNNIIILIATHDIFLIESITCTIHLMHHGQIIESATRSDLKQQNDVYPNIRRFIQKSF